MTTLVRARIIADDSPESPREWSNVGTFVGFPHRRYRIGDREINADEETALRHGGWAGLVRHLQRQYGATHVEAIGMYDHSGVAYYLGGGAHAFDAQGWDSGTCGFIYDSRESRQETGCPDNLIRDAFEAEIKAYTQWANGDVYGYVIEYRQLCAACDAIYVEDEDATPDACPHCDVNDDESCWGFYGLDPDNGMLDNAPADAHEAIREELAAYRVEYRDGRNVRAEWHALAA